MGERGPVGHRVAARGSRRGPVAVRRLRARRRRCPPDVLSFCIDDCPGVANNIVVRVDTACGRDCRVRRCGLIVADPFDESVDSLPAAGRVEELGIVGQRSLEDRNAPLGIGLVPGREVRHHHIIHVRIYATGSFEIKSRHRCTEHSTVGRPIVMVSARPRAGRSPFLGASSAARCVDVLVQSALREAGVADGRGRVRRRVDVVRHVGAGLVDVEAVVVVVCPCLARIGARHEVA